MYTSLNRKEDDEEEKKRGGRNRPDADLREHRARRLLARLARLARLEFEFDCEFDFESQADFLRVTSDESRAINGNDRSLSLSLPVIRSDSIALLTSLE